MVSCWACRASRDPHTVALMGPGDRWKRLMWCLINSLRHVQVHSRVVKYRVLAACMALLLSAGCSGAGDRRSVFNKPAAEERLRRHYAAHAEFRSQPRSLASKRTMPKRGAPPAKRSPSASSTAESTRAIPSSRGGPETSNIEGYTLTSPPARIAPPTTRTPIRWDREPAWRASWRPAGECPPTGAAEASRPFMGSPSTPR